MNSKNEHVEFVERTRADIIDMVNLKMDQMKEKFTVAGGVQERNAAGPQNQKKEEAQSGTGKYKGNKKRQMKGEGIWSMLGYEPTEKVNKDDKNAREGGLIDLGSNAQNAKNANSEKNMQGKGRTKHSMKK